MKIIDKYIYAIGQKLPIKGREETKKELKSLILDELENKHGNNPTQEEIESFIQNFGAPNSVAKKYSEQKSLIAQGLSDLYLLIFRIIIFAQVIAFSVILVIDFFKANFIFKEVMFGLLKLPLNIASGSFAGIGVLTIIFMLVTRFSKNSDINLDDDWTIKDLDDIELGNELESKPGCFISIFFTVLLIVFLLYPEILVSAENSFERSTLILGNRINLDIFKVYVPFIIIYLLGDITYNIFLIKQGLKTTLLKNVEVLLQGVFIIIMGSLVFNGDLFTLIENNNTHQIIGFRLIFIIVFVVSVAEFLVSIVVKIKNTVLNKVS